MARIKTEGLHGFEGLAAAVIARAALDLRSSSPRLRKDAAQFFESDWCSDLLVFLDMPPDARPR